MALPPRTAIYVIVTFLSLFALSQFRAASAVRQWQHAFGTSKPIYRLPPSQDTTKFSWGGRQQYFPVADFHPVPEPLLRQLPRVQYAFSEELESPQSREIRRQRLAQVKNALKRTWDAYRLKAWMHDELGPISGRHKTTFGGWAATLVDTLDTLWIMDLKDEFYEAVDAAVDINFSATTMRTINVFETNIRFLGGFISAYDLSGDKRLLHKALELADMLYATFDTPNRLPVLRFNFQLTAKGQEQFARKGTLLAEIGSLSLEFTRLSQITNDTKWYDAVHRIMAIFETQQHLSALPGMWPTLVDAEEADFSAGYEFSLAAWADSMYEYLPKMYALLGGSQSYANMYRSAMDAAIRTMLYRPMIRENITMLMPGNVRVLNGQVSMQPELQHLACFAGGMFALGGRLMENLTHVDIGNKLTNGCTWAYKTSLLGIMPETSQLIPCPDWRSCDWNETIWRSAVWNATDKDLKKENTTVDDIIKSQRLPPGFAAITNRHYLLRPEAIESVFVLYRITGDQALQEKAWSMFRSIHAFTWTPLAHAAITDVTNGTAPKEDSMESFW